MTKLSGGHDNFVAPNNDYQDNTTNNPPISPQGETRTRRRKAKAPPKAAPDWKPERFKGFWDFYRAIPGEGGRPRNENKQRAIEAWDALKADDKLIDTIARALLRQLATAEWKRGVSIPQAATYLNNARWTDAEDLPDPPQEGEAEEGAGGWAPDPEVTGHG